jgi:hypothetical protein
MAEGMADPDSQNLEKEGLEKERLEKLRQEFHAQTSRIPWHQLQTHYASGALILVSAELNLVEVAVQLQQDNKARFEQWIAEEKISGISDQLGQQFYAENPSLWAVVAPPWVLVQQQV